MIQRVRNCNSHRFLSIAVAWRLPTEALLPHPLPSDPEQLAVEQEGLEDLLGVERRWQLGGHGGSVNGTPKPYTGPSQARP